MCELLALLISMLILTVGLDYLRRHLIDMSMEPVSCFGVFGMFGVVSGTPSSKKSRISELVCGLISEATLAPEMKLRCSPEVPNKESSC